MTNALIGHSGFVGSTLKRQTEFDSTFRSTDIETIEGMTFGTVVCAAAPAKKWLANADPEQDSAIIDSLMSHLRTVTCDSFVLISTVDVFRNPIGVDENTPIVTDELQPYGLNRRRLEEFVTGQFERTLVVRLPGLVGPGLRKNAIYDLLHNNEVEKIDTRGVFQFYPMVNLWWDIKTALIAEVDVIHLTSEPVDIATVARDGFGRTFVNELDRPSAQYDFRTMHARLYGGSGAYQYSARDTISAVRAYAQSGGMEAGAVG